MAANIALTFSEAPSGKPREILGTEFPGVLIHKAEASLDFVWLWLSLTDYVDFSEAVYVCIVKGLDSGDYYVDSLIRVPSDKKILVESGIGISNFYELRAYIDPNASTKTNISVSATGYVHRRLEGFTGCGYGPWTSGVQYPTANQHYHENKQFLDKIAESVSKEFMYNGKELVTSTAMEWRSTEW